MTDRLTDAAVDEMGVRQPFYSQGSDAMLVCLTPRERDALVAEVRELRAARTLSDDDARWVRATKRDTANGYADEASWARPVVPRLLAIIEHLTEEADRDGGG